MGFFILLATKLANKSLQHVAGDVKLRGDLAEHARVAVHVTKSKIPVHQNRRGVR
jgi:hypothetical protein